jgi:hypothetical protein
VCDIIPWGAVIFIIISYTEIGHILLKLPHLSHLSRKDRQMYGKIYIDVLQETGPVFGKIYSRYDKFYHVNLIFNKKFCEELIAYCPLIQGPHRKRRVQQFFYCCLCIPCRVNVFTEPLPSNEWGYTHTDCWEGFVKYAVVMDSGAMIIHTKFHKDWFRHSNVGWGGGGDSQTQRQYDDFIRLKLN